MHSFVSNIRKFLVLTCVVLLCASVGLARGKKTTHSASKKTTSGSTHKKVSSKTSSKAGKASRSSKGTKSGKVKVAARSRGQQGISDDRAMEIQQALIKARYLEGEPSGVWDQSTRSAMAKFQGDNGWQTKVVPDSRALIKLGLGPNHSDVINPETSLMLPYANSSDRQLVSAGATPQR